MTKLNLPFKVKARVTQVFGNELYLDGVDVYGQWGYKGHNGIDYGLLNDTAIYAPHDGKIKENTYDKEGYGWYIKIESDKEGSVLAHNRKFVVKLGDEVTRGQLVGYSDNSGLSTGPHLHWGYYKLPRDRNNGYNGYIDQEPYLSQSGDEEEDCNKEKESLKTAHKEEVTKLKLDFEVEKKEVIEDELKKARKEWGVERLEGQVAECEKVTGTIAYKVAKNVSEILKALDIIKKLKGGN